MYISGFVNTICGTKLCEMPKNKRTIKVIIVIHHLTTLTLAQSCKLFVVLIIVMYKTNDVVLQHSVLHDKYTKLYNKKT